MFTAKRSVLNPAYAILYHNGRPFRVCPFSQAEQRLARLNSTARELRKYV